MSFLLNLFRKKDAHFYLGMADKAVGQERWVEARDAAEDGLTKAEAASQLDEKVYKELQRALKHARRGICDMNREEANYSAEAGELDRAMDLLSVALENAPDDRATKDIHREMGRLERRSVHRERSRVAGKMDKRKDLGDRAHTSAPIDQEEGVESADSDLFEVYLAGLVPEVAELYRALGAGFIKGYIALNEGDIQRAYQLLKNFTFEGKAAVFLDFEMARILHSLNKNGEARERISKVQEAFGYAPIYLSGNPSVAGVDAETLAALGETDAALDVLKEGRAVDPDNGELAELQIRLMATSKRYDEAQKAAEVELTKNARNSQMYLFLHQIFLLQDDDINAANALERGMSTCCSTGSCGPTDTVIPRTLIAHYLKMEESPKRIEDLFKELFRAQKGQVEWTDHFLRARFLKWQGQDEAGRNSWEAAMAACPADHPNRADIGSLYS